MQYEIEIWIEHDVTMISWNHETIQEIAEEMGEPEFPEPSPCGQMTMGDERRIESQQAVSRQQ